MGDRTASEELAWAAGIFEGEGTIVANGRTFRLVVKMTDRDVVEHFAAVMGGRVLGPYDAHDGVRKPAYVWMAHGVAAVYAGHRLYPWLHARRQARLRDWIDPTIQHTRLF